MVRPVPQVAGNRGLGFAGSTRLIATVGGLIVVAGAALGVLRYVGGTPSEHRLEGVAGAAALAAVVATPGVLALLALADRPALLLAAGTVLVPLSFLSFAGVTLPLLIPAAMLFVAYGRRSSMQPIRRGQTALTTAAVLALLVAAVAALFVHQDPRQYSTPTESGSTSDVITVAESLISLALVTTALAVSWVLTGPRWTNHG